MVCDVRSLLQNFIRTGDFSVFDLKELHAGCSGCCVQEVDCRQVVCRIWPLLLREPLAVQLIHGILDWQQSICSTMQLIDLCLLPQRGQEGCQEVVTIGSSAKRALDLIEDLIEEIQTSDCKDRLRKDWYVKRT